MFFEPVHQARTEIAQGEGLRWAINQIRFGHRVESAAAQHGAQAGKIFGERGKHAEPVLAIVNFQALEGSQAVVGLDDLIGHSAHRAAIGRDGAHAFGARQRSHDRTSHATLQVEKFHTAVASEALARK